MASLRDAMHAMKPSTIVNKKIMKESKQRRKKGLKSKGSPLGKFFIGRSNVTGRY